MSENSSFHTFQNTSVLVTGASGFIGRHLVASLVGYGAQVLGLSKTPSSDPLSFDGDVTKMPEVLAAFDQSEKRHSRPLDYIFHLAGQKNPALAHQHPRESLELSILGCLNLFEAARQQKNKVRKIIVVSSLAVYGTVEDQSGTLLKEDQLLKGDSIYSVSKIAPEYISRAYWGEYGIPTVVARLANVYGPGQSPEAVISSLIQQMLAGGNLKLGNMHSVRDFTFVEDIAEGLMALSLKESIEGKAFNLGSGHYYAISEIVECLVDLTGFKGAILTEVDRVRAQEKSFLVPDIKAFLKATGWQPKHTLKAGLARTLEAFRAQQIKNI